MLSPTALVVLSLLLADPDATPAGTRQAVPAAYQNDSSAWRPSVVALGATAGAVLGGVGGYWAGKYTCQGCGWSELNGASGAILGSVFLGVLGGVSAFVFTDPSVVGPRRTVTLVPTAGGRETAGLHFVMQF